MRETTGYRLPVSVKLGAGRVSDDVKIAVKDGFDFIELDGMQGSTGAGSAEVIDYVGVPTLPAIIEAIDALEDIGRRRDIEMRPSRAKKALLEYRAVMVVEIHIRTRQMVVDPPRHHWAISTAPLSAL